MIVLIAGFPNQEIYSLNCKTQLDVSQEITIYKINFFDPILRQQQSHY